ncbi:MAG: hypothetical protein KBC00_03245 [Candidatus Levybacteria bacterium]|nr:hypothetical protein [Candidatus Levybacteria bacterium]MBP9815316.1 hypothetical protein [Candidatus Levybacteria bacterium]
MLNSKENGRNMSIVARTALATTVAFGTLTTINYSSHVLADEKDTTPPFQNPRPGLQNRITVGQIAADQSSERINPRTEAQNMLPYSVEFNGFKNTFDKSGFFVVNNQNDWKNLYSKLSDNENSNVPKIDFSKESVGVVVLKQKGEYTTLSVVSTKEQENRVAMITRSKTDKEALCMDPSELAKKEETAAVLVVRTLKVADKPLTILQLENLGNTNINPCDITPPPSNTRTHGN